MHLDRFSEVTPYVAYLASLTIGESSIDTELYSKYEVKRGLRDVNGKGVLTGLTEISEVTSTKVVNGETVPCDGELCYRGYNVKDLVKGFTNDGRFGFEDGIEAFLQELFKDF